MNVLKEQTFLMASGESLKCITPLQKLAHGIACIPD